MPRSKWKRSKNLSQVEFRYLAERHLHEATKMQEKGLTTLSEAETLLGHFADMEHCLRSASDIAAALKDEQKEEADAAVAEVIE